MELSVRVEMHPTEDKERVLKAAENIFPSLVFKENKGFLEAVGKDQNDLAALKEHLKIQQIRNSARTFLMHSVEDKKLSFGLNKQAALMGKVSFVDFEIALGTIDVEIKGDLENLIDWLCT